MKPIVVYDDTCELCNHFADYIKKKMDKNSDKLEFLPASVAKEKLNLKDKEKYQFHKTVHLFVNEEKVLTQFQAVQEICHRANIFSFLHNIQSSLLISLFNLFYRFVAKFRKNFPFRFLTRILS